MHTPGDEIFVGVIHPAAALFERPFALSGARREHEAYVHLLEEEGARVHRVVDVLLAGTLWMKNEPLPGQALDKLRAFAKEFLTYNTEGLAEEEQTKRRGLPR